MRTIQDVGNWGGGIGEAEWELDRCYTLLLSELLNHNYFVNKLISNNKYFYEMK